MTPSWATVQVSETAASTSNLWTTAGGYWFDPVRFLLALSWYFGVVWIVGWAAREARRCRAPNDSWTFAITVSGLFGLLPILAIKFLPLGLFFALAMVLPMVFAYVHSGRNPYVRPDQRLLTDDHLIRTGRALLAGIGIHRANASDAGPMVGLRLPRELRTDLNAVASVKTLEEFVCSAIEVRASELAIEASRDRGVGKLRVDGVWRNNYVFDPVTAHSILDMIPKIAGLKSNEPRKTIECALPIRINGNTQTVHTSISNAVVRRRVSLILPAVNSPENVSQLGLSDRDRPILVEALRQEQGLILVVGPIGAGLWTTITACIGEIDALNHNIAVVEEPGRPYIGNKLVERYPVDLQHVAGMAAAIRRANSQKPHVLACGRLVGAEAVQVAMEASKERLVMACIDAENVVAGIFKLTEFGASRADVADRLLAALAQRLPRRLCASCREAYTPSPDAIRRANMAQFGVERLFRTPQTSPHPCTECKGVGYVGCLPLYELLPLTQRFRNLIRSNASEREMLLEARKEGMESASEMGIKLLASGMTSAEELRRVLQESPT